MQKIGESAQIELRKDETILQLRDLYELSTKEDFCEALKMELDAVIDVLAVKIIQWAYWGIKTALVLQPMHIARNGLEKRQVRIG